ncbi:hypothetical protein E2C01_011353 [Portunus trituberculatus]|uniref:Uncharacterized protein n=1 Tax=Portunus trituberculatus TaxID=210409 RepID=A0A5B7DAT5_PORTR|nr:hypothetical protein [Portunus trituberculatus]
MRNICRAETSNSSSFIAFKMLPMQTTTEEPTSASPLSLGGDLVPSEGVGIVSDLELPGEDDYGVPEVQITLLNALHRDALQEQPLGPQVILRVSRSTEWVKVVSTQRQISREHPVSMKALVTIGLAGKESSALSLVTINP